MASRRGESRSYRLLDAEPVPQGIARIARGRLGHALDELRGKSDSSPEKAVHEARKDMKKMRALLRLTRAELSRDLRREENARFRDAARELSGARDADVMIETLESLAETDPDRVPARARDGLRDLLVAHRDALARQGQAEAKKRAIATLREAQARVGAWPLESDNFGAFRKGLARTYRDGRRGYRAARKEPTVEALHDWRKRVKDLWYDLTILRCAWPEVMDAIGEEAHTLSEHLGLDHDHAVLLDFAREHPAAAGGPAELARLETAVEAKREELQRRAFERGERVYAEKTGAFADRIESYWDAWRG